MRFEKLLSILIICLVLASCGSKKKTISSSERQTADTGRRESIATSKNDNRSESPRNSYSYTVESYIREFAPIAQEEMKLYRIPASITLAQGILESGAGMGDLTRRANNHFGIKCHGWDGEKVYHDDDRRGECFRKYTLAKYSYRDHSLFLSKRGRYAFLFDLDPDDYRGWARGLRQAGYATDRKYPDKLIDIIERYELYRYDAEILGGKPLLPTRPLPADGDYIVKKGDTLYSISKRYNTTVEELKRTNRLNGNTISIGQVLKVK